jgi:nucleotide-binding universal stress UspA family protein
MSRPRIVIALDPERVSPEAIELGHALGAATGAPLGLLAVWHWWEPVELAMIAGESLREEADHVLRAVADRLRSRGHDVETRVAAASSVGAALHNAGRRDRTGLIVIGPTHAGAVGRVLVGTTAAGFLHGAPCPVAVASREYLAPERTLETIGIAYVETEEGQEALRGAAALAHRAGAQLRILTVAEAGVPPESLIMPGYGVEELLAERHAAAERIAAGAVASVPEDVDVEPVVLDGDPVSVLATASSELDLLVCGSRGYGPLGTVLLGSVSKRLLHRAAGPLLVIPRGRERRLESLLEGGSTAGLTAGA